MADSTKNIGWLCAEKYFETEVPDDLILQCLWDFCSISVAQSRGIYLCDICKPEQVIVTERNGHKLLLGSAEIRVFSDDVVYAAPNLIYHYVKDHHYKPPAEFVRALISEKRPPDPGYFGRLNELNIEWGMTLTR